MSPQEAKDKLLRHECLDFVQAQSGGEWGETLEKEDAEKLYAFVKQQIAMALED